MLHHRRNSQPALRRFPSPRFALGSSRLVVLSWIAFIGGMAIDSHAEDAAVARPTPAAIEFFEKSVRPILVQHCYECHSADDANGGLALDSRAGLLHGGDSGAAVVPGDPEQSRIIEAVRYKNPDLQMPPANRLAAAEIATLEKWIRLGAPDPREAAQAAVSTAPTGMSIADGRQFWSFQPVANPPEPQVTNKAWVRTPIDAFVLAKLEAAGLQPAPPADKRTLLRRVTYDLVGLPPTPEEMATFLADDSPDAFAKVVERLLASPGYGVRWGRHWLDVARYADSNGLDENLAFGNAWRYRDYVVDAFQRDKPFDQFLIEQLAGDLLPDADATTKTATGFLALGAKVLAEPDREKLVMDTIDEQLDTIGKTFLGLTLGCVRCHDHKFDPIKQTDYYALAAIFKSTKTIDEGKKGSIKNWHEYSFATKEDEAKLKEIDAQIATVKKTAADYKNVAVAKLRDAAKARATDYLVAALELDPQASLTAAEQIARPLGLHPHVLYGCRRYLESHHDDPLFAPWHTAAASNNSAAIKSHYEALFAEAETAWAAARKLDPKIAKLTDERLEAARAALADAAGFLALPSKPEFVFDAETLAEYHRLAELARIAESSAPDAPGAMGVSEGTVAATLPIHIRGSHRNLGKPVSRNVPEVMQTATQPPEFPSDQSGRLQLARWLADDRNPLTSRVYVNRVWRWHFGAGLVTSTDNFGRLGDRPTHPELLDWLASHFVSNGGSTKDLHRLILASSAYQSSASHPQDGDAFRVDPENHLLWRFRLQRLEAEQLRDAVLAVSGRLDDALGGKSIPLRNKQFVFDHTSIDHTKYDSLRRSLYLPVVRNNLYTLFEQFDFPDPTMPTGSRNSTVVAPQALLMMNSDLLLDSADAWAGKLIDASSADADRVHRAYEAALGRSPTSAEVRRAVGFVEAARAASSSTTQRQAWALFCQSLLACNEFIYVR